MKISMQEYLKRGLYLPPEFRDFHNQKDIFRFIGSLKKLNTDQVQVNWCDGMCYTIDQFLWIMAKCGYELRRTKKKVPRANLFEEMNKKKQADAAMLRRELERRKLVPQ